MKFAFVTFVVFLNINPTFGQHWTVLNGTAPSGRATAQYFLNPNYGFVYLPGFEYLDNKNSSPARLFPTRSKSGFLRTIDGGQSWQKLIFFDSIQMCISDLSFLNPAHGFATAVGFVTPQGGVFETRDSGRNWTRISPNACLYSSLYVSGNSIFATEIPISSMIGRGTLLYTHTGGLSWDSVIGPSNALTQIMCVIGNKDSLVVTTFADSSLATTLLWSSDLGYHWQQSALSPSIENGMVVFAYPHECKILLQHWTTDAPDDTYVFSQATPSDNVWIQSLDSETGRFIVGNSCAMYLSNADPALPNGLYRSIDRAGSWQNVGGPHLGELDDIDCRNSSAVGYGSVVYVSDPMAGRLYKTTDGGDGALSISMLQPQLSFTYHLSDSGKDSLNTVCNGGIITVIDQNLRCALTQFESVSIDGLNSSEYAVIRTHHASCLSLPDTTTIVVNTAIDTTRQINIIFHYIDDEYATTDTSFTIAVNSKAGNGKAYAASVSLPSRTIAAIAGDTICIPVEMNVVPASTQFRLTAKAIEFLSLSLNTDLLTPLDFVSSLPGATGSITGTTRTSADFSLVLKNGLAFSGGVQLGVLRFIVRVTDTTQTQVLLSKCFLTSSDSMCVKESVPEDGSNTLVTLLPLCGIRTISQFMNDSKQPEGILNVQPNPATNHVLITFRNDLKSPISYQLVDALGIDRLNESTSTNEAVIDVSNIPNSVYYLHTQAGGFSSSRTVVVNR